ncbi:S8 family serine peptidase [Sphingomonas panni]
MVNVGQGRRELLPGSAEALRLLGGLSRFRIWNFSLEYPDTSNSVIHSAFTSLFSSWPTHLFVTAAGNDGQAVGNRYPAAFGGPNRPNVVTVGATLPDGTLADFSAWGSQVDIAAPGCEVQSTIDEAAHVRGMSGTSQAAPQVSLTAALLRTFATLDSKQIKARLIVSGALIKAPPASAGMRRQPGMVWSRSALDIERAVDVLEDFVELADGRQYVGSVDAVEGLTCAGAGFPSPSTATTCGPSRPTEPGRGSSSAGRMTTRRSPRAPGPRGRAR